GSVRVQEGDGACALLPQRAEQLLTDLQGLLCSFTLRDVRNDAVQARRASFPGKSEPDAVAHPAHAGVGPDDTIFQLLVQALSFPDALQGILKPRLIVPVHNVEPAFRTGAEVLGLPPRDLLHHRG